MRPLQSAFAQGAAQQWREFAALPRAVRRRFALMAAPWAAVVAIGFPWLWNELDNAARAPVLRARESVLFEVQDILQRTVNSLRQDIILLGDLAAPLLPNPAAMDQLFITFAKSTATYDQVRWLDMQGHERLRVNTRGKAPQLASAQELQSKQDRAYFTRAVGLPPGDVYLSELDLNVEQGVVEQPPVPTLRVTAPIHQDDRPRGIVAINYRASRLLERLANLGKRQGLGVYLVNDAGFWLQAPRAEDSWAWQLGRAQVKLPATYPALWQAMVRSDRGRLVDDTGDWAFARFRPEASAAPGNGDHQKMLSDLGLRVVVHIPADATAQVGWRGRLVLLLLLASVLYFGTRIAWHAARALIDEEAQARRLRATNQALMEANDNLRTVQADLARAERLSSLGLMVAGVAHELNTPLGSAGLSLSTAQQLVTGLQEQLGSGLRKSDLDRFMEHARAALDLSEASIRRAAGIVQRFKQVAVDRTTMERRRFDLAEVIMDSDPRLRRWDPHNPIALHLELQKDLAMNSYPGPLEQVVANLLANALLHAFQGRIHGQVAIQALADGEDHVLIRISDDGIGIPAEHRSRIFDPFFTTNRHGGGTGLGLHISFQLVTDMLGGRIDVEAPAQGVGTGTTFVIRLPRVAPTRQ